MTTALLLSSAVLILIGLLSSDASGDAINFVLNWFEGVALAVTLGLVLTPMFGVVPVLGQVLARSIIVLGVTGTACQTTAFHGVGATVFKGVCIAAGTALVIQMLLHG